MEVVVTDTAIDPIVKSRADRSNKLHRKVGEHIRRIQLLIAFLPQEHYPAAGRLLQAIDQDDFIERQSHSKVNAL